MIDFPETNPNATARMRASVRQFNAEVRDFAVKVAPEEAVTMQRAIVLEGLRRLVMKTPVKTGRARGNWQVSIGKDTDSILDVTDKTGGPTILRGTAPVLGLRQLITCYITNNVEYIEALEKGHSQQAPAGMLAVTYEELKGMFK
jgi:hypothetical protein